MKKTAVILAAGKGTRMKSVRPKVLHKVGGQTMLEHVRRQVAPVIDTSPVAVIGYGGEEIRQTCGDSFRYVWQKEQLGTGHAVMQAKEALAGADQVLVLCGDTPLLKTETLDSLMNEHLEANNKATVMTVHMENPEGYGRIEKSSRGEIIRIIEEKDCDDKQRSIREINSGTYCFDREALISMLEKLSPDNAQGEYYLTDVIKFLRDEGLKVGTFLADDPDEIMGINDRVQLARAEKLLQKRINSFWMKNGVTIRDPDNVYLGPDVILGTDVEIAPGTILEGRTRIGEGSIIGPQCRITDAAVGSWCSLEKSIITESSVGDRCVIGPFAYIRPGCTIGNDVKIGDFVELKKTSINEGSKVPHHSYIGDTAIGKHVNVGAGTITCNYDGVNKYRTVIDDEVFVGSNTNLVAPVHLEKGSYIAAGSTITEDVPEGALGLARGRQRNIQDWRKKKGK